VSAGGGAPPPLPRALLHPRYWPTWIAVGAVSLAAFVPRIVRDGIAAAIGELRYHANARRRDTVALNLRYCFPGWTEARRRAVARAHFRAYARSAADHAVLWWDLRRRVPERLCEITGLEHVLAIRRTGRSVILLTPHTAAVDFGGIALTPYVTLSTMANTLRNPVLDWLVQRTRSAGYGVRVFDRRGGLRPVVRALRAGTVFYYMPDEDLGARDSVFAPFFGHPKATLTTLGRLAGMADAAVVPMYPYYEPHRRRYRIELLPPLDDFPSGDARRDACTMNEALERCIALAPEQYMWNYRLFRSRPDGSKNRYPSRGGRWH